MGSMSNYLEAALINEAVRGVAYTAPTAVYLALYTADPTEADVGTEVTGGSYTRQAITFVAPTDGVTTNTADITYPVATASWGTVTHFGVRDAVTGGNLLFYGALTTPRLVDVGNTIVAKLGQISVSLG